MNFSAATFIFLDKELEIPKDIDSTLVQKVREITVYYENQVTEIGKDFDVCIGSDSNFEKCLEIFNRIGVRN